jgi:hypothetical protein
METMWLLDQIGATPGGEITVTLANDQRLHVQGMVKSGVRYGSGFPIECEGDSYFPVTAIPGQTRMPAYFRLDARENNAFYRKDSKLTVDAEIANLTGHSNLQCWGFFPDVVPAGYLKAGCGNLLPIIPSVGVSAEF